jgi:hypothetical protein|tara:strand:- start:150 stop:590 length:441 start_codon:yes stop_codon:yes gene_type:complete
MSLLKNLEFAKNLPKVANPGKPKKSPLELAKIRLAKEIDVQIALAKNPKFKVVTSRKQRKTGKIIKSQRKPRSWVTSEDDSAYVTPRFANKVLNVGGKRGANIKTTPKKIVETLNVLNKWVASSESDAVLMKALEKARRGRRESAK